MTRIMRECPRPRIEVESTDFGLRVLTLREIGRKSMHVRMTNLVFPNGFVIPMSREMTITQWHVPIDDHKHYWYAIFTSFGAPVDKDEMRRQRLAMYELPDYTPRRNKRNDYGFDPHEQAHETYTGMGADINVHDQWACESMGEIADRTQEHLGQSDKAITAYRRLLRSAIDAVDQGGAPPIMIDAMSAANMTGPVAIDGIGPADDWEGYCRRTEASKRDSCSWANTR
jgi:phthalate 4,5-dioxygenase oxygenase subunit